MFCIQRNNLNPFNGLTQKAYFVQYEIVEESVTYRKINDDEFEVLFTRNDIGEVDSKQFNELGVLENLNVSKEELIKKIKRIRDYDYTQPNYIQMFIDSFVEAVYISKDKKIAVVLKLDDSNYLSKHNGSHDWALVDLIGLEPTTSSMPWRRSPR